MINYKLIYYSMIDIFIGIFGAKVALVFLLLLVFSIWWLIFLWVWIRRRDHFPIKKKLMLIPTTLFSITWIILVTMSFALVGLFWDRYTNEIWYIWTIWGICIMFFHGIFNYIYKKEINDRSSFEFWKTMILFGIISLIGIIAFSLR